MMKMNLFNKRAEFSMESTEESDFLKKYAVNVFPLNSLNNNDAFTLK